MDYKTLSLAQYSPHPCANMSSQSNLDVDTHTEVLNQWGLILSAVIYGAHIVLSALSVKPILERPKRQKALLFAYITLLFCLATAGFGVQAWWTQVVFIVNRDYPGGPVQFLVDNVHSLPCQAVTAIYILLNWLSDGIILHRFYTLCACDIIQGSRRWGLIFVIPSSIALFTTGIMFFPSITSLGINLWSSETSTPGIAYMALSLSVNTILTLLIIGRLLYLRRKLNAIFGTYGSDHSDTYTSVVALLIESAALYTVVALMTVVACGLSSPMQYVLLPMLGQLQAIPPLLITSRLATGTALSRHIYSAFVDRNRKSLCHKSSRQYSDMTSVHFTKTTPRRSSSTSYGLKPLEIRIDTDVVRDSDRPELSATTASPTCCCTPKGGGFESWYNFDIEGQIPLPEPVAHAV